MIEGAALAGWALAGILTVALARLRRRLELVARAEHEIRGPATVLSLAVERMRRDPTGRRHALVLAVELERMGCGLADLSAARRGRLAAPPPAVVELEPLARASVEAWSAALRDSGRSARLDWRARGARVRAAPGRLAQAVANLVSNAVEHGEGPVELRGRRTPKGVRLEITNRAAGRRGGEGRGLPVAARAATQIGGRLRFESDEGSTTASLELPEVDRG